MKKLIYAAAFLMPVLLQSCVVSEYTDYRRTAQNLAEYSAGLVRKTVFSSVVTLNGMSDAELSTEKKVYCDDSGLMLTVSSIMEESIASSQLEGASTDTEAAKRMLRENRAPKDKSELMIVNNYNAMRFVTEHSGDELSPDLIREIHSIISRGTLDDAGYEGRFRDDNSIAVRDAFSGETYHVPPDFSRVPDLIQALCGFANDDSVFVHPIVKGIVLHFGLAYIHPFMDGNGRVSRSLFYWYMLRSGYASAEYLSISKVLKVHRGRYGNAYLLSETDGNDITYFINHNLDVISEAVGVFLRYVRRKMEEDAKTLEDPRMSGLSIRHRHRSMLQSTAIRSLPTAWANFRCRAIYSESLGSELSIIAAMPLADMLSTI